MSAPLVNAAASATGTVKGAFRAALERLSPKQRQYAMLGAILLGGVGMLLLIFAFTDNGAKDKIAKSPAGTLGTVTNIGVMPPGQQVNPVDQWVGTAGSKLAQYESEREEQGRLNKDRQAFEARTMQRFSDLEQRLTSAAQAAQAPALPAPPLEAMPIELKPQPTKRLASTNPIRSFAGPDVRTWRWEASWPRKANWVKMMPLSLIHI